VFGASGYAGALCARLLHRHPSFMLTTVTSRSDVGRRVDELYPHHRVPMVLEELDLERHADVDAAIVAYPHGAAAELVAQLRRQGVKVVDLSADFRLRDAAVYEEWYRPHPEPGLIGEAVYGLPEHYRDQIAGASLVANPGCYHRGDLGLAPPARASYRRRRYRRKSGGERRARLHWRNALRHGRREHERYSAPRHRHTPEIERASRAGCRLSGHLHAAPRPARSRGCPATTRRATAA
jgi:N-acetyl-gamma-glutamyl-phosphate reductase